MRTLIAAVLLTASVSAAPPTGKQCTYKTIGETRLSIYVTEPEGTDFESPRPAILFFHGGGWVGGAPGQFTEHARYFASRGVTCFQAQYRLLDKQKNDPPRVCLQDARSAMRWVRRNAKQFNVDPQRIASAGGSAGGHLATALGTLTGNDEPGEDTAIDVRPNAMILFNPVFDNGPDGWGHGRVRERYKEFSPAHNIRSGTPPAIVFLGDKDSLIPVSTLETFQQQMISVGSRCETMIFPEMPHGFFNHNRYNNVPYLKTVTAADRFLKSLGWVSGEPTLRLPPENRKRKSLTEAE